MRSLDLADLVLIAGRALGLDSDAVLDLLDLEAADAALAAARLDGETARALTSLGVTAEAARAEIERIVGRGHGLPEDPIPFAPRVKKVLEMSTRESLRRGQAAVRSEHMLLALLAEGNGLAAKILVTLVGSRKRIERVTAGV